MKLQNLNYRTVPQPLTDGAEVWRYTYDSEHGKIVKEKLQIKDTGYSSWALYSGTKKIGTINKKRIDEVSIVIPRALVFSQEDDKAAFNAFQNFAKLSMEAAIKRANRLKAKYAKLSPQIGIRTHYC